MTMYKPVAGFTAMMAAMVCALGQASAVELPENDYPTAARADYVFACMQVNGQTRENLMKCSCSIDTIAELLPYEAYEEAETIMMVRQKGGENTSMFRSYQPYIDKVNRMKRAQVEAELRCF
jgi:hypothetical protein